MHKAFIRSLHQFLRFFLHLAHIEGFIEVTMETVVVDGDVHCVRMSAIVLQDKLDSIMFDTNKVLS